MAGDFDMARRLSALEREVQAARVNSSGMSGYFTLGGRLDSMQRRICALESSAPVPVEEPDVAVGQIWEHRSFGRRVRVNRICGGRVTYERLDGDRGDSGELEWFRETFRPVDEPSPAPEEREPHPVFADPLLCDECGAELTDASAKYVHGKVLCLGRCRPPSPAPEIKPQRIVEDKSPPAPSLNPEGLAKLDAEIDDLRQMKDPVAWRGRTDHTARQVRLEAYEHARSRLVSTPSEEAENGE